MKKKIIFLIVILAVVAGGYLYLWQGAEFGGIEKIKSYLLSFNLEAQLDEPETEESQSASQSTFDLELQPSIEELTEEALSLGETEETSAGAEAPACPVCQGKTKLTLEEIAERVNVIAIKVEIVATQIEYLRLSATLAQVKGATITKEAPKEKTQPTLGEIAEKLNEISEKIEMVSTQAEQLLSG